LDSIDILYIFKWLLVLLLLPLAKDIKTDIQN
jgi:hypothetical protein